MRQPHSRQPVARLNGFQRLCCDARHRQEPAVEYKQCVQLHQGPHSGYWVILSSDENPPGSPEVEHAWPTMLQIEMVMLFPGKPQHHHSVNLCTLNLRMRKRSDKPRVLGRLQDDQLRFQSPMSPSSLQGTIRDHGTVLGLRCYKGGQNTWQLNSDLK